MTLNSMLKEIEFGQYDRIRKPGGDYREFRSAIAGFTLAVMATYGRSGLKHLVLGSVAETVVRVSRVRVLTIRPAFGRAS